MYITYVMHIIKISRKQDELFHWVDTSAGVLLVSEGIIRPVVSASALTWFNR